jgi:signal transduction histidine kinase
MPARDDAAAVPRLPLAYRLTGRQWLAVDWVVAVVAMGIVLFNVGLLHGFRYQVPPSLTAALAVAGTLPVAVRRIWPVPVLAVVTVACGVLTVHGRVPNPVDVALGMAIYTAAVRCRRGTAVALLVGVEAALGAGVLAVEVSVRSQEDLARGLLVAGALWFVGDSVRERRRYLAGLAEQAALRQQAEAGRARQAIREERVRIARELHDVVAHSLSVVTVQAGVGRKIGAARPGEALRALRAVEVTGRGALEELRRILGLLRDGAEQPSLEPVPGIGDLEALADRVRAAGIPVRLAVTGDAAEPPPAVSLTAYRIVQEALTNVVKHARQAEASVRVQAGPDGVRIMVTDNGTAASGTAAEGSAAAGRAAAQAAGVIPRATAVTAQAGGTAGQHGIVGMRERAAAFGGTLDAGPVPGTGFRVTAFLPVSGLLAGQVA